MSALKYEDLGQLVGELGPDRQPTAEISLFAQIRLTAKDYVRLQTAGLDDLVVRRGAQDKPTYYMRLEADGSCAALARDGLCSIHPHRPTLCRAFPFYIDLFAGLTMVASCPGIGAGESTVDELRTEIEAAVEMYAFWVETVMGEPAAD